jgi:AraC-like DNA-binding protein
VLDSPPEDFRLLRFRSDEVPARQRLEAWTQVLGSKLLRADIEPLPGPPFHVEASLRLLEGVRFGTAAFSASFFRRTRKIVETDNDDFFLIVNMEGGLTVSEPSGEIALAEGDGYFMSCKEEKNFIRPFTGRLLGVRFDRARLTTAVPAIVHCAGQLISRESAGLRLLTIYLRDLDDNQKLTDPSLRKLVVSQIYEMAAFVLSPLCAMQSVKRGASAVRLEVLKKYVVENLKEQKLSIVDVAAAHELSQRQAQRAFETAGTTFSSFLLGQRLEHVHLALTDTRRAHRSISDIAASCGFGDVSYFNRAFRQRYDCSPSDVRAGRVADGNGSR